MKLLLHQVKDTTKFNSHNTLWGGTKDCSIKIRERNKAKNKLRRFLCEENLKIYRKKKAEAQMTIRQAKRNYWQTFCAKLDRFTPLAHIWRFVKKLNGVQTKASNNMASSGRW